MEKQLVSAATPHMCSTTVGHSSSFQTALHAGNLTRNLETGALRVRTPRCTLQSTLHTLKVCFLVHTFVGQESESRVPQQCLFLVSLDIPDVAGCIYGNQKAGLRWVSRMGHSQGWMLVLAASWSCFPRQMRTSCHFLT